MCDSKEKWRRELLAIIEKTNNEEQDYFQMKKDCKRMLSQLTEKEEEVNLNVDALIEKFKDVEKLENVLNRAKTTRESAMGISHQLKEMILQDMEYLEEMYKDTCKRRDQARQFLDSLESNEIRKLN